MTVSARDVETALERLGDTPDAVAATLKNKGVTGVVSDVDSCPIANYLADQFPEPHIRIVASRTVIEVWGEGDGLVTTASTPDPVLSFMQQFDRLERLDLVDLRSAF